MKDTTNHPTEYATRERKTSLFAGIMGVAWGLSLAVNSFALKHLPVTKFHFGIFALLVNVVIGLVALVAYIRWLSSLDEMLRKIWIESMAFTFGALWIAFGGLILLEYAEINYIDAVEIGLLTMFASLGMLSALVRICMYR